MACMPKSASTFLATAVGRMPGFRRCRLTPEWGAREQEICPIRLSRYNHCRYVAQHHIRYSAWTATMIKKYHLTPVVLVRNLADCVISIRDHNRNHPEDGPGPMAHFDDKYLEMDDAEFEEAIVRLAMPWYLNFYVGWKSADNVPFFDYEDYTQSPAKIIRTILANAGCEIDECKIKSTLASVAKSKETRFNVGKSGRGSQLSPRAKEALLRLLEFYPSFENDPLFEKSRRVLMQ